ncbi:amino acid racemase [Mesorhizobium sp. KR9-304]|uniref:aspartate/glutamate racemase family protein n=1 Tax=Mesorhizobium sp. KR9-304 TaxID=3156614 RepID=UPI0032B43B2F
MTNEPKVRRRIGIIGGMGPEATVLLMSRIIRATPVNDDSDHVPMIVDNNPQVPSRIAALIEKRGEDPGPVIVAMAKGLQSFGADALAMPCNTAHHFADRIRAAVSIPFLDMVRLSVEKIAAQAGPGTRVGMLASPAVRMTGVFDRALGASGLELAYLDDDGPLLGLIKHVKKWGGDKEALAEMALLADRLVEQGADLLLVACSELSLLTHALPGNIPFVDSIDVLSDACIAFSTRAPTGSLDDFAA